MATTVYKQITQKDLHMVTSKEIAVSHSLGGGVVVLFIIKLFGENFGLLIGRKRIRRAVTGASSLLPASARW